MFGVSLDTALCVHERERKKNDIHEFRTSPRTEQLSWIYKEGLDAQAYYNKVVRHTKINIHMCHCNSKQNLQNLSGTTA